MVYETNFNKNADLGIKSLLTLLLVLLNTLNVYCNGILELENSGSLPKVVSLQTYKDWSSRVSSTSNSTTPKTISLLAQESKDVKIPYRAIEYPLVASTQNTIANMRNSLITTSPASKTDEKKDEINAHNIAAQVLTKFVNISPLLAMSSSPIKKEIPSHQLNQTDSIRDIKNINNKEFKEVQSSKFRGMAALESLNEIDIDSSRDKTKPERKSASGISFPTIPSTSTTIPDNIFETSTTEIPQDFTHSHPEDDEESPHDHNDNHDNSDHSDHSSDDDEPLPPDDPEDYEDDEELESFRYPVRVTFQDSENDDDPIPPRDNSPPFIIPNIDLNPESLKQKGCRTVVKEVQAIPVENGLEKLPESQQQNINTRNKRSSDGNARKYTSIVMTKECHFPDDEGASSEQSPQKATVNNAMSGSKRDNAYQTAPQYDEYDPDFDFKPRLVYPSSGLPDTLNERQPDNRKKYTNVPNYRKESSEYRPRKSEYGFDDMGFYDSNDFISREDDSRNRNRMQSSPRSRGRTQKNHRSRGQIQNSPQSSDYYSDDEDYYSQPKPRGKSYNIRSNKKKPPMYRNEGNNRNSRHGKRRKPKKVNRSFAFFRRAEPKDKDPNENDYSVSYGRGNFHSFSDSYDSDRDGPRKGRGFTRSRKYE